MKISTEDDKPVLDKGDMDSIANFASFFDIPISPQLSQALDAFRKQPTITSQNAVKLELCRWIIETDSPIFKDEVWDGVKLAMGNIIYGLDFDKEIVKALTPEE